MIHQPLVVIFGLLITASLQQGPGANNLDLMAALAAAKKPVRCINAAAPRMAPPTAVETNRRYADYRAVQMDGVGHYLRLERPAKFNKLMREFLKEQAAR
jgi:pimeloyl-ACP methyl ester carboxylesterase